jgi:cobalt-precorrin 5A hydrolase
MVFEKATKMFSKGITVIAITRRGVETALKIQSALNKADLLCSVFAPKKYVQEGVVPLDGKLDAFIKENYSKSSATVAVMATGIIIRAVAPCLENKLVDPAVIGVDAAGNFVISLLAGHYGGANELARLIAAGIGATPVITTASEVLKQQSVDEIARNLRLTLHNPGSLTAVNAALVNGERLVLVLVGDVKISTGAIQGYTIEQAADAVQAVEILNRFDAGAVIAKEAVPSDRLTKPVTILTPKKIVVGVGARKNTDENEIVASVNYALTRVGVPLERVDRLATVDIKKTSRGMVAAAEKLGLPLEFVSVEALRSVKHVDLSPDSELVKEKIGVGGVCERAALISAGKNTELILKKMSMNGVTVAIAEGE